MTTGDQFVKFNNKQLIGFQDLDERFFRYLQGVSIEAVKRLFTQGSFDEKVVLTDNGSSAISIEDKVTAGDRVVHDGDGHIMDLALGTSTCVIPATSGVDYEVGIKYIEKPSILRVNPRTGKYEYVAYEESFGEQAEPDSVTDNGTTITFVVDSLFESGTPGDHTGRTVRVFKKIPGDDASTLAIAVLELTVSYDGNNKVTTATNSLLGQVEVSTVASDYYVQLDGPIVRKSDAANRPSLFPDTMFFVGVVTSNGGTPVAFDVADQLVISRDVEAVIETNESASFERLLFPSLLGSMTLHQNVTSWQWGIFPTSDGESDTIYEFESANHGYSAGGTFEYRLDVAISSGASIGDSNDHAATWSRDLGKQYIARARDGGVIDVIGTPVPNNSAALSPSVVTTTGTDNLLTMVKRKPFDDNDLQCIAAGADGAIHVFEMDGASAVKKTAADVADTFFSGASRYTVADGAVVLFAFDAVEYSSGASLDTWANAGTLPAGFIVQAGAYDDHTDAFYGVNRETGWVDSVKGRIRLAKCVDGIGDVWAYQNIQIKNYESLPDTLAGIRSYGMCAKNGVAIATIDMYESTPPGVLGLIVIDLVQNTAFFKKATLGWSETFTTHRFHIRTDGLVIGPYGITMGPIPERL